MRELLRFTALLTVLLLYPTINADAQDKTSTLTFAGKTNNTFKANGSGTADDGTIWTITSDAAESAYYTTVGIHFGKSDTEVSYVRVSTKGITGTVKKIVVNASTANNVTASVSTTVSGKTFGGSSKSLTSSDKAYTFTDSIVCGETDSISVLIAKPKKATGALYFMSVAVTYSADSTSTPDNPDTTSTTTKKDASVSFASKSYSFEVGSNDADSFEGQSATTTPEGLPLKYSIDANSDFAIIDSITGKVTLKKYVNGSATITATFEGNDTLSAASASYKVSVSYTATSA